MNILQISKTYFPDIGGVESVVKQYAEHLARKGHKVTVLTSKREFSFSTERETINGVEVIRCASFGVYFSMPVSLIFCYLFLKLIRKHDVIHFHEPFPLASICGACLVSKQKVVITWHSDIIRQKFFKPIVEYFQKILCNKANVITTTSKRLLDFSVVLRDFREKTVILPLSINPVDYDCQNTENSVFDRPRSKYVLFMGRMTSYKGVFVFIDAIKKISDPDISFVIAGTGSLSKEIEGRIKSAKDKRIVFIDKRLTEEEKKYLLANCLFLVFPSNYPNESFGIIQLEAMIYGKPVINTDLPTGVPWVSRHGETGLTVKADDANKLADAITQLLVNSDWITKMGEKATERVKLRFSDDMVLPRLGQLYN